jgi:Mrp family chromosome partitioning ATPase
MTGTVQTTSAAGYRVLALQVISMMEGSTQHALTVFSSLEKDSGSLVALNLAHALADFTPVLLIDGGIVGLADDDGSPVTNHEIKRLRLNSPGTTSLELSDGLTPEAAKASKDGYFTLISAPPSELTGDGYNFAMRSQHAVYVMGNKPADLAVHERALSSLKRLGVNVLGIVLTES